MTKHTLSQAARTLQTLSVAAAAFFASSTQALAIDPIVNKAIPDNLTDYATATSGAAFAYYFVFIWRALILIGGLLVIVYFIQAAFEWMSANGEASKISSARNRMTGAVAGFVVLIGVLVITQFIESAFGLNILNPTIPTASDPAFSSTSNSVPTP